MDGFTRGPRTRIERARVLLFRDVLSRLARGGRAKSKNARPPSCRLPRTLGTLGSALRPHAAARPGVGGRSRTRFPGLTENFSRALRASRTRPNQPARKTKNGRACRAASFRWAPSRTRALPVPGAAADGGCAVGRWSAGAFPPFGGWWGRLSGSALGGGLCLSLCPFLPLSLFLFVLSLWPFAVSAVCRCRRRSRRRQLVRRRCCLCSAGLSLAGLGSLWCFPRRQPWLVRFRSGTR